MEKDNVEEVTNLEFAKSTTDKYRYLILILVLKL